MINKNIAKILYDIERLLRIKGVAFKPDAYKKAGLALENLKEDVVEIEQKNGLKGLEKISRSFVSKPLKSIKIIAFCFWKVHKFSYF